MFKHSLWLVCVCLLAACDKPAPLEKIDIQVTPPKVVVEDLSVEQIKLAKLLKAVDERLLQWNALTADIQVDQTPLAIEHRDEMVRLRQTQVMDLEKSQLLSVIDHVKKQLKSCEQKIAMLSEWHKTKSSAQATRATYVQILQQEIVPADIRKDVLWAQVLVMEEGGEFTLATKQWNSLLMFFTEQLVGIQASLTAKSTALESQQLWLEIAKNVTGLNALIEEADTNFSEALALQTHYQYGVSAKGFERAHENWLQLTHKGIVQISMPNMLLLKGGVFEMGDNTGAGDNDELPLHEVTLASYRMSQTEVTFAQYDNFAKDAGKPLPSDEGWGRGQRPVINISWQDAHEFAQWLSEKSGKTLHLPSESQWEYAAKASRWDTQNAGNKANCEGCYKWDNKESVPVGQFPANAFGLHDMQGNVWEWTSDCYTEFYTPKASAPQNSCDNKAVRGGSWYDLPTQLRSTNRSKAASSKHSNRIGFRLVEELLPNRIASEPSS